VAQFDISLDRLANAETWPGCCARCGAKGSQLTRVPDRYAKKTDGFAIPLCAAHVDDWAKVGFRTRIGAAVMLLGMAGAAAAAWFLQPAQQNPMDRVGPALVAGFLAAFPLGALAALWAKSSIRVLAVEGRFATIAGVCRAFAKVMANQPEPELPAVSETARFDVQLYRPTPVLEPNIAAILLAIAFSLAALLGLAIGFGGLEIGRATAGWDPDDWRYVPFTCALLLAYTLRHFDLRGLFSRFGAMFILFVVVFVLVGLGFARLAGSMRMGFGVAFTGCALMLLEGLVHRFIWRRHVRNAAVAMAASSGGALIFIAVVYLIGGMEPGPHQSAYIVGLLIALCCTLMSRAYAKTPYCLECDGWLDPRRVGALPLPLHEAKAAIESGQILALAGVKPYQEIASIGDVELKVHSCLECRERGTVVLELFDCEKGGKNSKVPRLVKVDLWQYPGASLPVIETLFPPPEAPVSLDPASPAT